CSFPQAREQREYALEVPGAFALLMRHDQVLLHAQARKHTSALWHEADALARDDVGRKTLHRLAEEPHGAFARRQEADDAVHAGGLAGAVAAESREHPA